MQQTAKCRVPGGEAYITSQVETGQQTSQAIFFRIYQSCELESTKCSVNSFKAGILVQMPLQIYHSERFSIIEWVICWPTHEHVCISGQLINYIVNLKTSNSICYQNAAYLRWPTIAGVCWLCHLSMQTNSQLYEIAHFLPRVISFSIAFLVWVFSQVAARSKRKQLRS